MQVKALAVSLKLLASVVRNHSEALSILVDKVLRVDLVLVLISVLETLKLFDLVQVLTDLFRSRVFDQFIPAPMSTHADFLVKFIFEVGTLDDSLVESELKHLESNVNGTIEHRLLHVLVCIAAKV